MFDLTPYITGPVGAIIGVVSLKAWDGWLAKKRLDQGDFRNTTHAHSQLNDDLRASIKVLTEEIARMRAQARFNQEESDQRFARLESQARDERLRLEGVVQRLESELATERTDSASKDVRIAELEREVRELRLRVFGTDQPTPPPATA